MFWQDGPPLDSKMNATLTSRDQLYVSSLRFLSVDQVEKANSGHPGLPLGAAPMAYVLWSRFLRFNPANPSWLNRDRFILSAGHGSALNYALLYLFGYDLSLEELKNFRQLGSKTPGHPEYGWTPGIEATTGPLGQGFAMGVGMAIAERFLNARYGDIVDYNIYALVSDGDLMEGVAAEAASLAGHLKLGKIIYVYDDNDISLDGPCNLSYSEDIKTRFEGYGWHVQRVEDGNDLGAIEAAIASAKANTEQPSLISIKTHIGYGSPKQDSAKAHGSPLGAEATVATKEKLGWPVEPAFYVPEEVADIQAESKKVGADLESAWNAAFEKYKAENPTLAAELTAIGNGELSGDWAAALDAVEFADKPLATRDAGKTALNAAAKQIPYLIGGGADLASSTKTIIDDSGNFSAVERSGRNLWFGVREHAMGSAMNGIALSGLPNFGSTFLVFSDYMRGAIRLAALMKTKSLFVFTHDSVFVGEDGPTHEPIEHVMSLRLIPDLVVFRPADAYETAQAWKEALKLNGPSAIVLTRQVLPVLGGDRETIKNHFAKGGYVLREASGGAPDITLVASGSEVALAMTSAEKLEQEGVKTRVVSLPSWELFDQQPASYRDSVLIPGSKRVSLEAGVSAGWQKYVGDQGRVISIDRFGESAPGEVVYEHLGFTVERVVAEAKSLLA